MKQALQPFLLLFFVWIMTISKAADILKNPDFEIPPSNTTSNTTSQFSLLNSANSLPGWSSNGTVWYTTLNNLSHALRLGENGKINQTFRGSDDFMYHILSFSLAAQNEDCANNNRTAVSVSVRERPDLGRSEVFVLGKNLSRSGLWENHAFYMGGFDREDSVNLEIASVGSNSSGGNVTCWPLVDKFTIQRNGMSRWYDGNMLANGDFEFGPAFLKNSSDGILLHEDDEPTSPLQDWSVLGTIKYISSKNYKIPHGKAAIQLLYGASSAPSGVQKQLKYLPIKSTYTLNFTISDANDSCVGDFMVYVQVGQNVHNFTVRSNGTGSADYIHSIKFKGDQSYLRDTSLSFYSFNETRRRDGVLCGPVLDNVVLVGSYGERRELCNGVLVFGLFVALIVLVV